MTRLAWTFLRSAGWRRAVLLAGTTALATALVLVALTVLLLPLDRIEALLSLILPGSPWATAFVTALPVLPLLFLLNQVVRLGTATRERGLASLRLAGATPAEVRRIGAVEVGLPVIVGALSGPFLFALLRELLGGQHLARPSGGSYLDLSRVPTLIPTSVTPAWWQIAVVVAVVAVAGVATGALASRHLITSPLGVSRRAPRPAPRPWGLLLVGTGMAALGAVVTGSPLATFVSRVVRSGEAMGLAGLLLVLLGAVALAPWVAFRSGQFAARRTSDPATLIATGHLVSDPRPAGRAAAAVGAIGIVSGVAAVIEVNPFFTSAYVDPFNVVSLAPVGVALVLVLLIVATTLAVHAAESLVDRRKVLAALVAAGTPVSVLRDSLRREAMLTCMPLSVGGVLLGVSVAAVIRVARGLATSGLATSTGNLTDPLLFVCGQAVITVVLTWAAIHLAILVVAPQLLQVSAPANLRTG